MDFKNRGKFCLHKIVSGVILILCIVLSLSFINFPIQNLKNNYNYSLANSRQADNSKLLTPSGDKRVQTLSFSENYDWTKEITQNFTGTSGELAKRVHCKTNVDGKNLKMLPSPGGTVDNGELSISSGTVSWFDKTTIWNLLYEVDNTLFKFLDAGMLQMRVTFKYRTSCNDDWGAICVKCYDQPEINLSEFEDGIIYDSKKENYDFDSQWKNINKNNITVCFFHKNVSGDTSGIFSDINISFRINWDTVANHLKGFDMGVVSTFDSKIGTPNLFGNTRDQAISKESLSENGNAFTHTPSTFDAWTNYGQRIFFVVDTDEGFRTTANGNTIYDDVTFSKNGQTKSFEQAKNDGWLSADSSIRYKDNIINDATFDWTFTQNGVYNIKIYSNKGNYVDWQVTIGGIDKESVGKPDLSGSPNGENGWFIGNGENLDKITLNNAVDLSNEAEGSAPLRYFYALSHSVTDFSDCENIENATPDNIETWYTGYIDITDNFELPITAGFYKMRLVAVDYAGNMSLTSNTLEFKVDNQKPLFVPSININGEMYRGEWTNNLIDAKFLKNQNISDVSYFYQTFNSETSTESGWQSLNDNNLLIGGDNQIIDCYYQFKAKSEAGLEYIVIPKKTNFSDENGYLIKFDSINPSAPIHSVGDGINLDDYLKPKSVENARWYTSGWNVLAEFTITDDFIGDGVKLVYEIFDETNLDRKNSGQYFLENEISKYNLNFNIVFNSINTDIGGVKILRYWTLDQAGNKSEIVEKRLLVDANKYYIHANIAKNSLFPNVPGYYNGLKSTGYVRGDNTSVFSIAETTGYKFYKLISDGIDIQDQLNNLTYKVDFTGGDDFSDAPSDITMDAYFRRIVEITGTQCTDYNGYFQKSELSANVIDPDGIDFINNINVYYNGILNVDNIIKAGTYAVTFDVTDFNNANENYFISANPYDFIINKVDLNIITIAGQFKEYGDADPKALEFTYSGLQGDDKLIGALQREVGEDIGSYPIKRGTLAVDNDRSDCYNFIINERDFQIKKRSITVKPNIEYNSGEYKNSAYVFSGDGIYEITQGSLCSIDGITDKLNIKFTTVGVNVGNYNLHAISNEDGDVNSANSNYNITIENVNFEITKRILDFVYKDSTKVYGDADPKFIITVADISRITEIGDSVKNVIGDCYGNLRDAGENVGVYDFQTGDEIINIINNNYGLGEISVGDAKFIINKRHTNIEIPIGQSFEYGKDIKIQYNFTNLLDGHSGSVDLSLANVNVGLQDVAGNNFAILNGEEIVTENYKISFNEDKTKIEITPYIIDLSLCDLEDMVYNSNLNYPLKDAYLNFDMPIINGKKEINITVDGNAKLDSKCIGLRSLIDFGGCFKLIDNEATGKTFNYEINLIGEYEINIVKAGLTAKLIINEELKTFLKEYDGTTLVNDTDFEIFVEGILKKDNIEVSIRQINFNNANVAQCESVNVVYMISGDDAENYKINDNSIFEYSAKITPAEVTIDLNNQIVYGESYFNTKLNYLGFVKDDFNTIKPIAEVSGYETDYIVGDSVTETSKTLNLSEDDYTTIKGQVEANGNYVLATRGSIAKNVIIAKRPLNARLSETVFESGTTNDNLNIELLFGENDIYNSDVIGENLIIPEITSDGTYIIEVTITNENYYLVTSQFTIWIDNKTKVDIVINIPHKVYDGNAFNESDISGIIVKNGEEIITEINLIFEFEPEINAGTYHIKVIVDDENYAGQKSGTYTVEKRTVEIIPNGNQFKIYGESDNELQYIANNLLENDKISGELKREYGENVGHYNYDISNLYINDNYIIVLNDNENQIAFEIKKRTAYLVFNDLQKVYDNLPFAENEFSYVLTNVLEGDDVVINGNAKIDNANSGIYDIDISDMAVNNENYILAVKSGKGTILKRKATVTLNTDSKIYGELDDLSYTIKNILDTHKINGEIVRDAGENAGIYNLDISALTFGDDTINGNYEIVIENENYTIHKAVLNLDADNIFTTYGDAINLDNININVSGWKFDDKEKQQISFNKFFTETEPINAGIYKNAITIECDTELQNYIMHPLLIDATIKQAELDVMAVPQNIVYGSSLQKVNFDVDENQLKYNDTIDVIKGSFAVETNNGKPGSYNIVINQPFFAEDNNYNITTIYEDILFEIYKKQIKVSENNFIAKDKQFDGSNKIDVLFNFDKIGNDDITVNFNALFTNVNAGTHDVIVSGFKLYGNDADCYYMVDADGNLIENNYTITLNGTILRYKWVIDENFVTVQPKIYDGTNKINKANVDIKIPEHLSDTLTDVIGLYNDKNAGNNKIIDLEIRFNIPLSAQNIEFVYDSNINLTVTSSSVIFDVKLFNQKIHKRELLFKNGIKGGTRQFAITESGNNSTANLDYYFTNIISGDSVYLDYKACFVDADGNPMFDVGENIKIVIDGEIGLMGDDSINYSLNLSGFDFDNLKGNILPVGIEMDLGVNDKPYDTTTDAIVNNNGIIKTKSFIDNQNYYDVLQDYFVWSFDFANFENADVKLVNGIPSVKIVIIEGIDFEILPEAYEEFANYHPSVFKKENYSLNNVIDGEFYARATITPIKLSIDSDSVKLQNKIYDGSLKGKICDGVICRGVEHLPIDIKVLFNVIWASENAGSDIKANITIDSLKAFYGDEIVSNNNFTFDKSLQVTRYGDITPVQVKITNISVFDKIYDGTTNAIIENILFRLFMTDENGSEIFLTDEGAYAGDDLQVIIGNASFPKKDVFYNSVNGEILPYNITIKNVVLKGEDKANYCFHFDGKHFISELDSFTKVIATAKINPLELRYDIETQNKIYDGTTDVIYNFNIKTQIPNGENIKITANAYFASPNANDFAMVMFDNVQIINNDNLVDKNYKLFGGFDNITSSAKIAKDIIDVEINSQTRTYGDNNASFLITYKLNGKTLIYDEENNILSDNKGNKIDGFIPLHAFTNATKISDVGTYAIKYNLGFADNYKFNVAVGDFIIEKAVLKATVDEYTRYINENNPEFIVNLEGFKLNQNKTTANIEQLPVAKTEANKSSIAGTYDIVISGGKAQNYEFDTSFKGVLNVINGTVSGFTFTDYDSKADDVYIKHVIYDGTTKSMAINQRPGYLFERRYYTNPEKTQEANTIIDAGAYYITITIYKLAPNNIDKDSGYIPQTLNGILYIDKANAVIEAENKTAVYSGKGIEIDKAFCEGNLNLNYRYLTTDGKELTGAPIDVGVYTVRIEYDGYDLNYEANFVEVVLTITKIPITVNIVQNKFIADGEPKTVIFKSNAPEGVLSSPNFFGENTSLVGTYKYEITSLDDNYQVINGIGNIVVGKSSVSIPGGGTAIALENTILDESMSFNVDNVSAGNDVISKNIWTSVENLLSRNSKLSGMIHAQAFIEDKDGLKTSTEPNGVIKLVLNIPSDVKIKKSTKLYRYDDDGTLVAVDAVFNDSQVEFTTDKIGYFVFVEDGNVKTNILYSVFGIICVALAVLAIIIVVRKMKLYRLIKEANIQSKKKK